MLDAQTPFPQVGSYAVIIDKDLPYPQEAELVRLLGVRWHGGEGIALLSFPLRDGASGNKEVPLAELINAAPLNIEEQREFHILDRELFGREIRTKGQKAKEARRTELKRRMIWVPFLEKKLRIARDRQAQQRHAA